MSIDRIGKTGSTSSARSKKTERKGDAAGFSKLLGGADEVEASGSAAAGGVGSVTGLDAILALQQVNPDASGRQKARQRGERILGALERLRDDILIGRISAGTMQTLSAEVAQARGQVNDPKLTAVLDEIDLRAQVELAKIEMNRRG